jgi:hypothetical protein
MRIAAVSRPCPWPRCDRHIQPSQVSCKNHWATLPPELQRDWLAVRNSDDPVAITKVRDAIEEHARTAA